MLPIYQHAKEIIQAIRAHRVVVIEGPAGCGKTTQLPRLLHEARLIPNMMGITQPRRIAAVSVAWRIAEEEKAEVGHFVGYAIRFDDKTSPQTKIKVMTDGILLQEARSDPKLGAYDIIMVDEAHERSLNIDFTLGLLHRVLQMRPDLKVVISSATLYPGHFQKFFADVVPHVPVIRIESRTYPIEINYQPLNGSGAPWAVAESVVEALQGLYTQGLDGHVLVFLPGEGIIHRVQEALLTQNWPDVEVLPLFGRLTRQEQERIFDEFLGKHKIILATNIAETSITIDKVTTVVDSGLGKLPWFNTRTGVTTLRESPISQASATQRAGRAGRTGPGRVVRLYDEASWEQRPQYTPEEILRIDLSEAVLRLIDLGVHDIENFHFPTPPPKVKLQAALRALENMGAIDAQRHLTAIGRQMVPFPLSPALARMVVEAANRFPKATYDVLLVGAFLSVRSPWTYPAGEEEQARQAQKRLAQPLGDAVTAVATFYRWRRAADRQVFCKKNYLDPDTMTFIERSHQQLIDIAQQHGLEVQEQAAEPEQIVRCIACGFADKLLIRRGPIYQTLTELNVAVHPSSSVYQTSERFAVAAELMSAGRTYAFNVSVLKPEWVQECNPLAAQQWRLTQKRGKRQDKPREELVLPPTFLHLAGFKLPIHARGGKRPMVDIPLAAVSQLQQISFDALPKDATRWRAQIICPYGVLARGSLHEILAMIPHIPWPEIDKEYNSNAPLGALLEPDRNLHTLGRYLSDLLQPVLGAKIAHPGWLALVSNGSGGFWYDVIPDFGDALRSSQDALDDLRDRHADETVSMAEKLTELWTQLRHQAERLSAALSAARNAR